MTLEAVAGFARAISLCISPTKTEVFMVHPRAAASRRTRCVLLDGTLLPWRLAVRYLGLTVDHRLTWFQ